MRRAQLEDWDGFDVFEVARLSRGRPLESVALAALQHFGLVEKLGLPAAKLSAFLRARPAPAPPAQAPLHARGICKAGCPCVSPHIVPERHETQRSDRSVRNAQ